MICHLSVYFPSSRFLCPELPIARSFLSLFVSSDEGEKLYDMPCASHIYTLARQGNEIDWSLTSYPELSLEGIEFVTLPSGLHAIDEDVM